MSNNLAIQVKNLSKQYRIGASLGRHDTLRDAIINTMKGMLFKRSTKKENTIWALKDISLDIAFGEVVGIIGRNGAGKSTLLKILSRITEPTEGRAVINGRVGSLLEVGTGFHPELTGRENIYLNGAILGMRRIEIERKFDEIVAFAEIEKFLDTPVKRYSSGMYVRLAFSVAAHLEPEILLVDEVLAVGDIAFQKKCLGKMENVAHQGQTVLYVSHNLASIKNLCSRVIWLEDGILHASGESVEVVEQYQHKMFAQARDNSGTQHFPKAKNDQHGIEVHSVKPVHEKHNGIVTLKIEISGYTSQPIARMGFGIQFTTQDGQLISFLGSWEVNAFLQNIHGRWSCAFIFEDIARRLAGGNYLINLRVNRPQFGIIINLENACQVNIPLTDVYGNGIFFDMNRHGFVPLPVEFTETTGLQGKHQ